jgi:Protein of unknown function (DUF1501)
MFTRREMLSRMGTGLGTLGLAAVLAEDSNAASRGDSSSGSQSSGSPLSTKAPHFAPRAKRIIHLYMNGGPSHVDTFDHKPELAKQQGQRPESTKDLKTENGTGGLMPSAFKFERRGESGLEISELYRETGRHADDLCVINGMYTDIPNHEPSMFMMNSGHVQAIRPSYGSWLLYGLGTENQNLPGYVVLCPGLPVNGAANWSNRFLPGVFQGCHMKLPTNFDPKQVIPHLANAKLSSGSQRRQLDLIQQMNAQHAAGRSESLLDARIASFEMAFRMQSAAPEAFDWQSEPESVKSEYYGTDGKMSDFGMNCLLARRMIERGVRVVQVYYGDSQPWDTHSDNDSQHRQLCGKTDRPIAALLSDLKQRGLLDETIVLWGGEFGRTPASQGNNGRDHNHWGFSVWLAGGGVKGGMTYGATDEFGFRAVENRTHPHDLHATMLHLMGINHEKLTYHFGGRDFRLTDVHGRVINEIIA